MRGLPVQAVLLIGIADEFLCILSDATVLLREVLGMGIRQCRAHIDGGDLVAPYAARQVFPSFPAGASKYHWPAAFFMSGIGNASLSAPTSNNSLLSLNFRQRFVIW